jgi:Protein of unknown function (DUF2934)
MDEYRVTGEPTGTPDSDRFKAETAHHHPTKAGTTDDEEIRAYAYALWVAEGRPDGQDARHWCEAEYHLRARKAGLPRCRR